MSQAVLHTPERILRRPHSSARTTMSHTRQAPSQLAEFVRAMLFVVYMLFYSVVSLAGFVVGMICLLMAPVVILFGTLFLVGFLLQLATLVFSGLGLV